MNTETAISTYVFGIVIVLLIGLTIRRMLRGWEGRARRQADLIGTLPPLPDRLSPAVVGPDRGLYVGSTLAPNWLERVAVGDLGDRAKAVLTRYPEGILVDRQGASPIWIPQASVTAVRSERGLAGKVVPGAGSGGPGGILVIRWRLPSGTEIDTGFRGDPPRDYSQWIQQTGGSQ
ncbi:MAG: transporter [Mycobacterium sp.]